MSARGLDKWCDKNVKQFCFLGYNTITSDFTKNSVMSLEVVSK